MIITGWPSCQTSVSLGHVINIMSASRARDHIGPKWAQMGPRAMVSVRIRICLSKFCLFRVLCSVWRNFDWIRHHVTRIWPFETCMSKWIPNMHFRNMHFEFQFDLCWKTNPKQLFLLSLCGASLVSLLWALYPMSPRCLKSILCTSRITSWEWS